MPDDGRLNILLNIGKFKMCDKRFNHMVYMPKVRSKISEPILGNTLSIMATESIND